jgi:hypothetical protein
MAACKERVLGGPEADMTKVFDFGKSIIALCVTVAILLYVANSLVGSIDVMPGYAAVYVDDVAHTYLALPCQPEWQTRKTATVDILRLTKASEAYALKYNPDDECREAGGFAQDGPGIVRKYMTDWGWLPPVHHWWDDPYRTEDGTVIYPNGKTSS